MDELKGPNVQIVLHIKEGLGFGFLRTPFIICGSLNGYVLETDPIVPSHTPVFDAELVWEADKRRFRSLRVQNVPVKVEVYTVGTQGRKDKVGYMLLSLLGAQPCPSNKIIDVKYSWHKLLGVGSDGKCCHPQLMMSLSIQDRINTHTPRNELRIFHNNEIAYPREYSGANQPPGKSVLMTLNEYLAESKKTVSSPELQPKLNCDEGYIQIGAGKDMFILSLIIGAVENLDMLLAEDDVRSKETPFYNVTYSVFTHNIMTDRVPSSSDGTSSRAVFNQRTSLRLCSSLTDLGRYFAECPSMVTRICAGDKDIGICSVDLRKLVPCVDLEEFLQKFCNSEKALSIAERCFVLRTTPPQAPRPRRPYVDVEMTFKYVHNSAVQKPQLLSARSATQLCSSSREPLHCGSGSCTQLDRDVAAVAYTNISDANTDRYKNASGEALLQTNELTDLIRKMYESFTVSQEKLASRPTTADVHTQCYGGAATTAIGVTPPIGDMPPIGETPTIGQKFGPETTGVSPMEESTAKETDQHKKVESEAFILGNGKSDENIIRNEKEMVKLAISGKDRDVIMQKFVDELEEWKEKQQQLYTCQLRRKEEYHLELLGREWSKQRGELEDKLRRGIEQCRTLAADLARATADFRLRGYRNTEREKKLLDAKKALETHYTAKYQELRLASQKMEDDMNHRIKMKDMALEELELKIQQLEKTIDNLKNTIMNNEKEVESKHSGLTKDQTASLIQELRCVEEKLDNALQSKAFFKEQWGRAVRELHLLKLATRRQVLQQLHRDRKQLGDVGLDTVQDENEEEMPNNKSQLDIKRLKDDFYVDILAQTPLVESNSYISSGPDGMAMFEDFKKNNPMNDKLNELICQRDKLIEQENPDEALIKSLNQEIRSMLLNCGS